MPNIQSAKKELRKIKKRTALNNAKKEAYKKAIRQALKDKTAVALTAAQKALDKAAKSGVIKKNTASRKLSRLSKKMAVAKK